jgi:hypothetical protein
MNKRWFVTAAALLGLFAAPGLTQAAVIVSTLPNPTVEPNLLIAGSDGVSGAILASRTLAYAGVSNPAAFHGTVTEAVIRDVTTGGLDFVYQAHTDATATEGATRATTNPFPTTINIGAGPQGTPVPDGPTAYGAGYTTLLNATLTAAGFTATTPGTDPSDGDRNGTVIGFQRASGTELPPGAFGNIVFVRTDATAFADIGTLQLLDGDIAAIKAWVPVAVPEPSTVVMALSGLALCGVAGLRHRSRKVS